MSIRKDDARVAVESSLRQSTYTSYLRLLGGIGVLDLDAVSHIDRGRALSRPNGGRP
jgi:hypothetical protein